MSANRRKKKKKQANRANANINQKPAQKAEPIYQADSIEPDAQVQDEFSTEQSQAVENLDAAGTTEESCDDVQERSESLDFPVTEENGLPDFPEEECDAPNWEDSEEEQEEPEEEEAPEEPEDGEPQEDMKAEREARDQKRRDGNPPVDWAAVKQGLTKAGNQVSAFAVKAGKALQKVKPRYWAAGGAVAGAAFISLLLVGIFSWEWFGIVPQQRPVDGTWSMEQAEPAFYLTLREDGTAIVTNNGLSIQGTYNLFEDDRISFHVATELQDAWAGEFRYWATDTGLTLTRIAKESPQDTAESGSVDAEMENVIQFEKQESDITEVPVPENPTVDDQLIGSWSDVFQTVTYTFRSDGMLTIDYQGAYYNATYSVEDGQLAVTTYIPGEQSVQDTNPYTIADGLLTFGKIELIKEE